ncbi:zinc finger protein 335 isoform X1 [Lates japonicus]|uniref:Zinc finger protein 335 isoform X1 n=1 Tax=Lates japonicus TaxID=270547 RepID=A0AAD3QU98_LATJO|nr:zinc finger protein 335 isoform X1 [Lates japonicus]
MLNWPVQLVSSHRSSAEGPSIHLSDQGDLQGNFEPDQPDDQPDTRLPRVTAAVSLTSPSTPAIPPSTWTAVQMAQTRLGITVTRTCQDTWNAVGLTRTPPAEVTTWWSAVPGILSVRWMMESSCIIHAVTLTAVQTTAPKQVGSMGLSMVRECVAAADSEQPGCSRYQARDDDEDDEQNQDPDQPQHSQQQPQHSCYMESSNGPEASLYADDSSSSDHPLADTAGSGGLPEALECSESQPGPYISSSGTYTSNPEPELAQQCSPSQEEPQGSHGPQDEPGLAREMETSTVAEGSGDSTTKPS